MIKIILTVMISVFAGILQSTLLVRVALYNAIPDLALCIVVFSAYVNGTMTGQVSGFLSGLLLDFLSAAPLGLNCLIRTLVGALAGIFKGAFFLDAFFLPVILCALATIVKAALFFLLHLILGASVPIYSLTAPVFWVELGLNSLSAPLLFALLKRLRPLSLNWSKN
ncbi:MAG: rod shape-determining protein MreD [Treponema sp.]|jgi:rod shape-determining protein MreD|nr:rod shape-determining protein MreD [Treponema sp.]